MYIYTPGTQMTSIFEGQLPRNKPFSNQNMVHLGSRYMYKCNDTPDKCKCYNSETPVVDWLTFCFSISNQFCSKSNFL